MLLKKTYVYVSSLRTTKQLTFNIVTNSGREEVKWTRVLAYIKKSRFEINKTAHTTTKKSFTNKCHWYNRLKYLWRRWKKKRTTIWSRGVLKNVSCSISASFKLLNRLYNDNAELRIYELVLVRDRESVEIMCMLRPANIFEKNCCLIVNRTCHETSWLRKS